MHDPYGPPLMRKGPLVRAAFVQRPNRFLGIVRLLEDWADTPAGAEVRAHIADPGRLKELLVLGAQVRLAPALGAETGSAGVPGAATSAATKRSTAFSVAMVEYGGVLVSIDSGVPNRLVREALRAGAFPGICCPAEPARGAGGKRRVQSEYAWGKSRFDFRLQEDGKPDCLVEVKSVTLVVDGIALFPDAPTQRGARHMRELAEAARQGLRGAVVFVIQRPDAFAFAPNVAMDPAFADALQEAAGVGAKVIAVKCDVTESTIRMVDQVEVRLRPQDG